MPREWQEARQRSHKVITDGSIVRAPLAPPSRSRRFFGGRGERATDAARPHPSQPVAPDQRAARLRPALWHAGLQPLKPPENPCGAAPRARWGEVTNMDAEIAALEARRDKTRVLKQGMMQELLTGRIRLV